MSITRNSAKFGARWEISDSISFSTLHPLALSYARRMVEGYSNGSTSTGRGRGGARGGRGNGSSRGRGGANAGRSQPAEPGAIPAGEHSSIPFRGNETTAKPVDSS